MKNLGILLRKYFITGLLVLIPLWATWYVLSSLLIVIDGILGDLPGRFFGRSFPGLGIATLMFFVLTVGMLSANYLGKRLLRTGEQLMHKVPIVRGIYTTVKQIMETFSVEHNFHGVALVEYPRKGCYSLGFMTGNVPGEALGNDGKYLSVFVPTTPNPTAGFLLLLPESDVKQLNMSVDEGMKYIISIGLVPLSSHHVDKLLTTPEEPRS